MVYVPDTFILTLMILMAVERRLFIPMFHPGPMPDYQVMRALLIYGLAVVGRCQGGEAELLQLTAAFRQDQIFGLALPRSICGFHVLIMAFLVILNFGIL